MFSSTLFLAKRKAMRFHTLRFRLKSLRTSRQVSKQTQEEVASWPKLSCKSSVQPICKSSVTWRSRRMISRMCSYKYSRINSSFSLSANSSSLSPSWSKSCWTKRAPLKQSELLQNSCLAEYQRQHSLNSRTKWSMWNKPSLKSFDSWWKLRMVSSLARLNLSICL